MVCSQGGKQLASLKVGGSKSKVCSGLYLANLRGDLRLEWLRISKWSGELPREVNVNQSRIHRADGSIVYGQVVGFDASTGEFIIKSESGESRMARGRRSPRCFCRCPAKTSRGRSALSTRMERG